MTDGNSQSPASRPDGNQIRGQLLLLPLYSLVTLTSSPHIQAPE